MIRNLTLILFSVLAACHINAQVIMRYGPEIDTGWGDKGAVVTPYVSFPATFVSPYAGNSITKVRIGVCEEGKNVYLYIKQKPQDNKYIYRQKLENLKAGWNEITLDTPFLINGSDDIAIGYKASFDNEGGVGCSNEKFSDANTVYYNSKNKWTTADGSVCIQALVEGDDMPVNEMMISKMNSQTAPYEASTATFTAVVRNVGANDVNSYTAICGFDGDRQTLTINHDVAVNASDTISFEVPATTPGTHEVSITLDMVNGQPDAYAANNTATAELTVRDKAYMRRVVCEEYTGTWCGWCPRGMVGLEIMKEKYPDQFIAISIHGGDELEIDAAQTYSYKEFIASCPGAPSCNVNRKMTGDPYSDIQSLFNVETSGVNHIAYRLTGEWNADSTAITLHSVYSSDIDIEDPQYNIAYTITEDSITGYAQTNYYAGGSNGELFGWENKSAKTYDVQFNDVARAIFSSYSGDPCDTGDMTAGTEYTSTSTIPVPPSVVNKKNIHVIGQIIDRGSGYIQNAMSIVPAAAGTTDGIVSAPASSSHEVGVSRIGNVIEVMTTGDSHHGMKVCAYNASGVCVASMPLAGNAAHVSLPAKGMYIIKVYDGKQVVNTTKLIY